MRRFFALAIALCSIGAAPALAQRDTGGLPQAVQWGMQQAMNDLENKSRGITVESMMEEVGAEAIESFVEGAVVRLILSPDGKFTSYALEGGDLVSFTLGSQQVRLGEDWEVVDDWIKTQGDFKVPKKPKKLALTLSAQGQEVAVDCHNRYGQAETEVIYYVGPLDGLFCMGLADEGDG